MALRNLVLILLLTATTADHQLRGAGAKKHHASKHHHRGFPDRPEKDSDTVERPIAIGEKAGIVVVASRHQLDLVQEGAVTFISKKLSEMGENGVVTVDKSMPMPGMPADAKEHLALKDIKLSDLSIKAVEPHELHVALKLGFAADGDVQSKGKEVATAHLAPFGTISLALGVNHSAGGQPQLELRSSDVKFDSLDMVLNTGGVQRLKLNKMLFETPMVKGMLGNVAKGLKPKIIEFLNKKLSVMAPVPVGQQVKALPSFVSLGATQDGGIRLAVDVAPAKTGSSTTAEECSEPYPSMPHHSLATGSRAMIAMRVFNCFLKVAHRDGLLSMDKLAKQKGLSLAQTDTEDPNPMDLANMQITEAPECHSSKRHGLVCNVKFTTSLEINEQKPKFNAYAKMGVALGIKSTHSTAIMQPAMTTCDGNFELDMHSVETGLSRLMFAGMGAGLAPMVCKAMPSLVELLPHVDLGPQFHGSTIDFDEDFVTVSTSVNPFDLKALSLAQSEASVHERYPPNLRELHYHHDQAARKAVEKQTREATDPSFLRLKKVKQQDEEMKKAEVAAQFNKGVAWVEEMMTNAAEADIKTQETMKWAKQAMMQQGDFD